MTDNLITALKRNRFVLKPDLLLTANGPQRDLALVVEGSRVVSVGPAAQLSDKATAASYGNQHAVRQFAREIDLLTFEFENIPRSTIEWAEREQVVRPSGEILHIAQNRLREIPAPQIRVRCTARAAAPALRTVA